MSLVAAYSFDEGTGTVAADLSGNGYNADLDVDAIWVPGQTGTALSSNSNSNASATASMGIVAPPAFTIMGHVKIKYTGPYETILSVRDTFFTPSVNLYRGGAGAFLAELFPVSGGSSAKLYSADNKLSTTEFHHVALRWDGTTVQLFVDGQPVPAGSNGGATWGSRNWTSGTAAWGFVRIGGDNISNPGIWDNLRLYDVAVSNAEIMLLSKTPVSSDVTVFYKPSGLEEGTVSHDGMNFESSGIYLYTDGFHSSWVTFTDLAVPNGATASSAFLTITKGAGFPVGDSFVRGHAVDNSPAPSDGATALAKYGSKTTASTNLPAVSSDTRFVVDITAIVNEIVSRPGWQSGNDLTILIEPNTGNSENYYSGDNASAPASAPEFAITYTASGAPPQEPTSPAAYVLDTDGTTRLAVANVYVLDADGITRLPASFKGIV